MSINCITGIVTRALPTADGLDIKVSGDAGTLELIVPCEQGELISLIRTARMSGQEITVRYTGDRRVIGTAAPRLAIAA